MQRLQGKVALITGGGGGIGAAAGRLFCAEGGSVVLVDSDAGALEATAAALRAQMGAKLGAKLGAKSGAKSGAKLVAQLVDKHVAHFVADVADGEQAVRAVAHAMDAFGRLDVLVNNAAMRNYSALAEATHAEWRSVLDVNLVGAAHYCRAALPELRRSGNGSIVNVSSCHAVTGRKGMGIYDATKAALLALTRTLAFEEAAHGVRANAVCPGSTLTTFHIKRGKAAGRSIEQLTGDRKDNSLIGRWGTPEEIAYPILWLASDEASFITGATLMVDGGLSIM